MERGKYRTILASLAGVLWMLMVVGLSLAQEAKPAEEPAKAEAPAAAPAAAPAPKLPTYFTATSEDPKKPPAWPDPTGGNTGVWATPAGDAKGDIPEKLSIQDVYDRMAHNLYFNQLRLGVGHGLPWLCSCRPASCWWRRVSVAQRIALTHPR